MLLYIIRHGDPDYKKDCLTEKGLLQAEAVGKRMAAAEIDRVFTSPMGRARETAAPACRLLGLTPTVETWAHEVEDERLTPYPDGVLKSCSDLQNTVFRMNGSMDLPFDRTLEATGLNGAHMEPAIERIREGGRDFLERLGYREENGIYRILRPNEEKVALFCHVVFSTVWLSELLHLPLHLLWGGTRVTHTGVTILHFKNYEDGFTAPRMLCMSDMTHLYMEGLDTTYDRKIALK
ncbi:MAG: histidine phosphatase family protein [Clostridia bacterium]|nr:histidine phosphatase family protein [Clostridia bacterium]